MGDVVALSAHPRFKQVREAEVAKSVIAHLVGRSPRWIEMKMKEGLPYHREPNGYARFFPSEVKRWVEENASERSA